MLNVSLYQSLAFPPTSITVAPASLILCLSPSDGHNALTKCQTQKIARISPAQSNHSVKLNEVIPSLAIANWN